MQPHTLAALRYDNPWLDGADVSSWAAAHVPKRFLTRTVELAEDPRVCMLIGPRQVGKSTLIWKTLAETRQPFLYLNCEDLAVNELMRSPSLFLAEVDQLAPDCPLFFEEVQALSDAGRFLKGLVDRKTGRWLLATGSSAFDLAAQTRESLAGRAQRHLLLPFSMDEVVPPGRAPALRRADRAAALNRVCVAGSYPTSWFADDPELELGALVEAFVIRDASDRFRLRDVAAFRTLLRLMASQIGNLCNFSEWAAISGVSNDTVREHARLLEDAHIVRLVPPFVGGKRAEITKRPKVYFVDNGVRNTLHGGFAPFDNRPDAGALMENFVFGELLRNTNPLLHTVRYWRSKSGAEVDFVLRHRDRILAMEIKVGDARGNLSRPARSFIDAYEPESFLVVNAGAPQLRQQGQSTLEFIGPLEVAQRIRAFLAD